MSYRLLIADDHAVVREGLRYMFVGSEIEIVAEAGDGERAVQLAINNELDVVLLDLQMPGGGLVALAEIKASKPLLPVVMYSAHDRQDVAESSMALGAHAYLSKRADSHTLRAVLLNACESRWCGQAEATVAQTKKIDPKD
jgi:DNA-binding NarL/FixJ family response regulator